MAASSESEVMEAPLEQALERGTKTLKRVLSRAGAHAVKPLQTTTNEVDYLMGALRLAIEAADFASDPAERLLYQARLRGLATMTRLRKAAAPFLETGAVCELLGVSRETIRKKVDRRQLLALPKGGDRVFPEFQFHEGGVLPGFAEALAALETDSPFTAVSFFLSQNADWNGRRALDLLRAGEAELVLTEARGFLRHGA